MEYTSKFNSRAPFGHLILAGTLYTLCGDKTTSADWKRRPEVPKDAKLCRLCKRIAEESYPNELGPQGDFIKGCLK